jgi:hypothetical protein
VDDWLFPNACYEINDEEMNDSTVIEESCYVLFVSGLAFGNVQGPANNSRSIEDSSEILQLMLLDFISGGKECCIYVGETLFDPPNPNCVNSQRRKNRW